jgi:DNA-directed RNA polymerase specialized sigma24 family protein
MREEERFDSFYLKTRRALVHQTFALTGDLPAAQRAVRDAYVAAWQHWPKLAAHDDRRDWVRPRAWQLAQRRHTARLWHRTKDIPVEDRAVLDALHRLPMAERRALLLVQLAGVPLDVAARELNAPVEVVEQHLQAATARLAVQLDTDSSTVRAPLVALGEAAATAPLPRPSAIRREGRRRRRSHTLVGAVAATVLAVGAGAFAHEPAPDPAEGAATFEAAPADPSPSATEPEEPALPSADDLLEERHIRALAPRQRWREVSTDDNTDGDGINTVCQQQRFADPEGLAALVREFAAPGRPYRAATQTVEISDSAETAQRTYETVVGWYTGCPGGRLQLQRSYTVRGIGDEASVLVLEGWHAPPTGYTVGIARVGQVVTWIVSRTVRGPATRPSRATEALADAVRLICARVGRTGCVRPSPGLRLSAPALSGEERGILATVDLPGLDGVERPWVGTTPKGAPSNPAATTCDQADFRAAGAERTRTRTFLVPGAKLPDRFGLTETYGTFARPRAADRFLSRIEQRFSRCEDRELATEVLSRRPIERDGLEGATWTLRTEVSERSDVLFDVGFVRRGRSVAQVTFLPAGRADLSDAEFRDLVLRAGERLGELG